MGLFAEPRCQKVGSAFFVLLDPFFGEAAVADFRKNLAHFLAGLLGNDPWARGVVSLFSGVADRIAHVAETAAIDQVDDQLQFVQAFKVCDLWLLPFIPTPLEP